MTGFLGEFEATLDAKGRFLLPAGFKKQLAEGEDSRFVINRGFESCLTLYPMKSWETLFGQISQLSDFDPKSRVFQRQFLNGANYVEPDTAGRILLPGILKAYAGLEKNITLVSVVNKLEIWDSSKYKKLFDSFNADDYSNLAQDVMVKKDDGTKN